MMMILCAVPAEKGELLARALLAEKLAACVQLVPGIQSWYWWQGKLEHAEEALLIAKTQKDRYAAAACRLRQLHPYEVPEIVGIALDQVDADYHQWLVQSLK